MEPSDDSELPSQTRCFGIFSRRPFKSAKRFKSCICKFRSTLRDQYKNSFIKQAHASFVEVNANGLIQDSVKADQAMESASPELPSQIMYFEILPRLPYKSLMRFKCVCKSWSSLIRNPAFVNAHQKLGRNKHTHLLFTNRDKDRKQQHFFSTHIDQQGSLTPATHVLSLPTPRIWENFLLYTAQAINGLVCIYLSNNNSISHQFDPEIPVRIFNPCTRECVTLPHSFEAFLECHVAHHFGFSPLENEYKVLQVQMDLFRGREHTQFLFKIFKLGTSLWRHVEVDLNDLSFLLDWPFHKRSVYVNGAIHWMNWSQNVIVVFDIGDEKFRVIPLAKDFTGDMKTYVDYPFGDLIEQGGCLALISDRLLMEQNTLELWILKDYQNHVWVKETIIFPVLWRKLEYPFPFCTTHSGELLFASKINIRKEPTLLRMHLYSMQGSKIYRESETCLPAEWTFPGSTQLKLLSSYQESVFPLR